MTRDQQEPFAALGQRAQLAAVVRGFGDGVAIGAQHVTNLVQQMAAARADARDVLENHQLWRVVGECLQHQEHATHGETVEGLIGVGFAQALRQQA